MVKCANFVCLNEASGLKKLRGKFCKRCLQDNNPFVFECETCNNTFIPKGKTFSVIPKSCSSKCRNRRKYLRNGKEWSKKYAKKHPRPKVMKKAKLCKNCDEAFKGFERRVFCTKKCASEFDRKYNKMNRLFKYTKKMVEQHLNLSKPQETLYVTRH